MMVKTEEVVGIIVELCALKQELNKEVASILRDKVKSEVYCILGEGQQ